MALNKVVAVNSIKKLGQIAPNTISNRAPRLLMWFTNGKICKDRLPIPAAEGELNYLESLKARCLKAQKTNTPIIFAYAGTLSEDQKGALED